MSLKKIGNCFKQHNVGEIIKRAKFSKYYKGFKNSVLIFILKTRLYIILYIYYWYSLNIKNNRNDN